jgi:hypothetical protein
MQLLRARGIESEARIPFASLLELIRPALGMVELIPGPQAVALESALALRPATAQERFAVGAATLSLLAAYAEGGPLAVIIDDAQWLDDSSAQALLFAFRRLLADPIAVLLAIREGEPSLLDGADLPTLQIGGLSRQETTILLDRIAPDVAVRLHEATAGNPLAVLELGSDASELALAPEGAPLLVSARVSDAFLRRAGNSTMRRGGRWCWRRPATPAISLCSSAPRVISRSIWGHCPRPRTQGWCSCGTGRSSSAIRSRARRSTPTPPPRSGARPIARWPPPCPIGTSTAALGTWPLQRWAQTRPPRVRSNRPAIALGDAARTRLPPWRSNAPQDWPPSTSDAGTC